MADNLIQMCNKYIEKGKIDKFYEYIKTNDLTQEFVKQSFSKTYRYKPEGKEYEEIMNVTNFALKISMEELKEKYGEKLTNRFAEIIYKNENPFERMFNLINLMKYQKQPISEVEATEIEKILDLSLKEDRVIGTHIIGAEIR